MKRDTRKPTYWTPAQAAVWGPQVAEQLQRGEQVEIAGFLLRRAPDQVALELIQ
jgi:hypothetical protein